MIRPLRVDEIEAAVALWDACGLTRPWNDARADAALALNTATSTILAAFYGERLTGTVMTGFDGHRGWVYYLAVPPEQRRAGTGRALMAAAEEWLAAHDAPKIQLMVRSDNVEAAAFYAGLGFERQDVSVWDRRMTPLP